jgi:CDP-diacylglycerol--serine O-phosphatidyltransferase
MDLKQNECDTDQAPKKTFQRGIYLLPNLLTTAALFAGFYAIVAAMKGNFEIAAIAIFVAMVADSLDGRVARLMNTQTSFGAEYDSLSDMAAFGIAPSLVVYSWSLVQLGKIGWLIAFLYTATTALRLARFNTQVTDKRYFQGLPSPAAAGILASLVWMGSSYDLDGLSLSILVGILTVLASVLMVSSMRYYSFKNIDFKGKVPFFTSVIIVLILVGIAMDPSEVLFGLFFIYVFSGPLFTLLQLRKVRRQRLSENKNHKS